MSGFELSCPTPHAGRVVTLAHGAGGTAMNELLAERIAPVLGSEPLRHDAAVLDIGGRIAMTTDGFVVSPLFFPGGDIGRLAVFGTVNDLWVTGAVPTALSVALVLEEGLPFEVLDRIVASLRDASDEAGVRIVTGDTKVVDRGKADGAYVTTTGLGQVDDGVDIGPWRVRPGDAVLVSGDIGRHAVAVMSVREGLAFDGALDSDCGSVGPAVRALLAAGAVHCLRDPTRGGLGAVLSEIARAAGVDVRIRDDVVPVATSTRAACEILGLDPMFMACEGRIAAFVPETAAGPALAALQALEPAAVRIGTVAEGPGRVWRADAFGGERSMVVPRGSPLPRIC